MHPRFGPPDPILMQTEEEIALLQQALLGTQFGRLPLSQNIEDRRGMGRSGMLPEKAYATELQPFEEMAEEWEGVSSPTKRDLDTLYKYMPQDFDASNNLLYNFFMKFPDYTRSLMIHEGRNPAESPDKYAITPDEWAELNRFRSTQIDRPTVWDYSPNDDDPEDWEVEAVDPDK